MSFAHIAGLPLEETLATAGPALLAALAAVAARLRIARSGGKRWPTHRRRRDAEIARR